MIVLLVALLMGGDSLKTEVVFLGDMPAERAIALWDKVIGPAPGATIIQGRSPDVVVVKDTPERLRRFRTLLQALSGATQGERIFVRPVRWIAPSELARLASEIRGDDGVVYVPDDRASQLVVRTTTTRYRELDKLFRKLDRAPTENPNGARRVIGVEPEPEGGLP